MSALVQPFRNGVWNAASSQVTAVVPGCVGLVGQDVVRPSAWPPDPDARHGNLVQDALELRAVAVMPWCQEEGKGPASSVGDEVDFGGESSTGASQALADLTTSSSLTASFRSTGSTRFVPRRAPL